MARRKVVHAEMHPDGPRLHIDVPRLDAAVGLGLSPDAADAEVLGQAPMLQAWLRSRLIVTGDRGPCAPTENLAHMVGAANNPRLRVTLHYRCPTPVGALRLRDSSLDGPSDHQTIVKGLGQAPLILRDPSSIAVLTHEEGLWPVIRTFVVEGVVHLATGYDHLLFLLSLLLALRLKGHRYKHSLRAAASMVTAFTLGHSLTLVAAARGWVGVPIEPVEAVIALSIFVVAGLNLLRRSDGSVRPALALTFGLIHGLGFSSVLAELGLPRSHEVVGLLAFNVGIEVGQLVFVLVLLVPLVHLAQRRWYRPVVVTGGSVAMATVGMVWFVERAGLI